MSVLSQTKFWTPVSRDGIAPRGLRRRDAARYVGYQPEAFDAAVLDGGLPRPFWGEGLSSALWDRHHLHEMRWPIATIYVVGFKNYVKIGYTRDFTRRLMALQAGIPEPITVYGTFSGSMRTEAELHQRYARYKTRSEWFRKEGALKEFVADLIYDRQHPRAAGEALPK